MGRPSAPLSASTSAPSRAAVLVVSDRYGGAEKYLNSLYGGLRSAGVSASLVGRLPSASTILTPAEPLPLSAKWSRKNLLRGLARLPRERRIVRAAFSDFTPDWIHVQFKREQIGFTKVLSELAPVIWTEHGVLSRTSPLRRSYARAAQSASGIICVSPAVAESISDLVPPRKIRVIENTFGVKRSDAGRLERADNTRSSTRTEVLWVGRLDTAKRPSLAIDYARANPDHHVTVAGTGALSQVFARAARDLPNLEWRGHVDDVEPLMRAASVLMFTSTGRGEGMPTVLAEAAAAGLPVVTHEGSGAEWLVRDLEGTIVRSARDMDQWRRAFESPSTPSDDRLDLWLSAHSLEVWVEAHHRAFQEFTAAPRS